MSRANANTAEATRATTATLELSTMITNMHAQIEKAKGPLDAAIEQAHTATTALTQAGAADPFVKTSTFTPVKTMTETHDTNPLLTDPLPPSLHALLTSLPNPQLENLVTALTRLSNTPPETNPLESSERRASREEIQSNLESQAIFNESTADGLRISNHHHCH